MVKSLLAFSGAETAAAAAAVTLTQHLDRAAYLRPVRRSDRDDAVTRPLAAYRIAWLTVERLLLRSRVLCKSSHRYLRVLHLADSKLEDRLWHEPISCSCWLATLFLTRRQRQPASLK